MSVVAGLSSLPSVKAEKPSAKITVGSAAHIIDTVTSAMTNESNTFLIF